MPSEAVVWPQRGWAPKCPSPYVDPHLEYYLTWAPPPVGISWHFAQSSRTLCWLKDGGDLYSHLLGHLAVWSSWEVHARKWPFMGCQKATEMKQSKQEHNSLVQALGVQPRPVWLSWLEHHPVTERLWV